MHYSGTSLDNPCVGNTIYIACSKKQKVRKDMKKTENRNFCGRVPQTVLTQKILSPEEFSRAEKKRSLMKKIINDRKAALDALAKY